MFRYAYDWEFVATNTSGAAHIDPVSVGIVDVDNTDRRYYAIVYGFNDGTFVANPWLVANVLPHLPYQASPGRTHLILDCDHPDAHLVKPRAQIAAEVLDFVLAGAALPADGDTTSLAQLWADHAAYDHVCLSRLFGSMSDLPRGIPMWSHDVQQEAARTGATRELPAHTGREHHALDDALWCAERVRHLDLAAARWTAAAARAGYPHIGDPARPSSIIIGGDAGRAPYQGSPL